MFDTGIGDEREHSSSFLYLSVPLYALREILFAIRARDWTRVNATIQESRRTLGGCRETIRVEIWYGYRIDGRHYAGRLIRDRVLWGVKKVIDRYSLGTNVAAWVNPADPNESYLPSGIGYFEPLLIAIVDIGVLVVLVGIPATIIASYFHR